MFNLTQCSFGRKNTQSQPRILSKFDRNFFNLKNQIQTSKSLRRPPQSINEQIQKDFQRTYVKPSLESIKQQNSNQEDYKQLLSHIFIGKGDGYHPIRQLRQIKAIEKYQYVPYYRMRNMQQKSTTNLNTPRTTELKRTVGINFLKKLSKYPHQNSKGVTENNNFHKSSIEQFLLKRDNHEDDEKLEKVFCQYILQDQKQYNKQIILTKDFDRNCPIQLDEVKHLDEILPRKKVVYKELGFNEEELKSKRLLLEKIMLERMILKRKSDFQ